MVVASPDIAGCVPHSGTMVLLDSVVEWDAVRICCTAPAPTAEHPLARDGAVPAMAAIEYGAQAAAVHGFLLERATQPRAGVLAKLYEVKLQATAIGSNPLQVNAELISRSDGGCIYAFVVASGHISVASGRILLAFRDGRP